MELKLSFIYLSDVRIHAFHGVDTQETAVGADFIINLKVGYPIEQAMQTDDLDDTLSYAEMFNIIKHEMQQPSKLLENVAGRIANGIVSAFPNISSIDLSITKENPPMGADCKGAGVEIHLINNKTI